MNSRDLLFIVDAKDAKVAEPLRAIPLTLAGALWRVTLFWAGCQWMPSLCPPRALQLRREARMVFLAMGAAMMGTMYFLWARCAQHGGSASGGGLVCVSTKLQGSTLPL